MGHATRLLPGMARFILALSGALSGAFSKSVGDQGLPMGIDVRYAVSYHYRDVRHSARDHQAGEPRINDLGIDSLDFLDIAFAIDKTFGSRCHSSSGPRRSTRGKATTDQYFVLQNLCTQHRMSLLRPKGRNTHVA